jgi:hypothetical protein
LPDHLDYVTFTISGRIRQKKMRGRISVHCRESELRRRELGCTIANGIGSGQKAVQVREEMAGPAAEEILFGLVMSEVVAVGAIGRDDTLSGAAGSDETAFGARTIEEAALAAKTVAVGKTLRAGATDELACRSTRREEAALDATGSDELALQTDGREVGTGPAVTELPSLERTCIWETVSRPTTKDETPLGVAGREKVASRAAATDEATLRAGATDEAALGAGATEETPFRAETMELTTFVAMAAEAEDQISSTQPVGAEPEEMILLTDAVRDPVGKGTPSTEESPESDLAIAGVVASIHTIGRVGTGIGRDGG